MLTTSQQPRQQPSATVEDLTIQYRGLREQVEVVLTHLKNAETLMSRQRHTDRLAQLLHQLVQVRVVYFDLGGDLIALASVILETDGEQQLHLFPCRQTRETSTCACSPRLGLKRGEVGLSTNDT